MLPFFGFLDFRILRFSGFGLFQADLGPPKYIYAKFQCRTPRSHPVIPSPREFSAETVKKSGNAAIFNFRFSLSMIYIYISFEGGKLSPPGNHLNCGFQGFRLFQPDLGPPKYIYAKFQCRTPRSQPVIPSPREFSAETVKKIANI